MSEQGTSRRRFLGGAAAAGVGLAAGVGVAAGYGIRSAGDGKASTDRYPASADPEATANAVVPFYADRQSGITTAQQGRLMFAALDVTTTDVEELKRMLGRWAAIAARLTAGKLVSNSPVRDEQPAFDLCIQACADDPQVVFHAVRNMVRAARGTAVLKWSQLGFGRASATGSGQQTPRSLMGFKDGTNNIHADDTATLDEQVWVGANATWMANGSYLVARKIRMEIESWDTDSLTDQERIFAQRAHPAGRARTQRRDPAAPSRLQRHGRAGSGYRELAAGLFFIAFQRDPQAQFKALQNQAGALRPAERVHRTHRGWALGLPARRQRARGLVRQGLVRLSPVRGEQQPRGASNDRTSSIVTHRVCLNTDPHGPAADERSAYPNE